MKKQSKIRQSGRGKTREPGYRDDSSDSRNAPGGSYNAPGTAFGEPTAETILALFGESGKAGKASRRKIIGQDEILRLFSSGKGGKKGHKRLVEDLLHELTAEGRLVRLKGPAYTLPEQLRQLRGRISIQRQGMGFVLPDGKSGRDNEIYVHPSQLGGAWDGDRVLLALLPGQSGKKPEGRVLEVLARSIKETAVTLLPEKVKEDGQIKRLARPLDARLHGYLLVDISPLAQKPQPEDSLLVRLLPETEQKRDGVIRATAVTLLGDQKTLPLHERLVKASHGISTEFPKAVLDECAQLPAELAPELTIAAAEQLPAETPAAKTASRRDLRQIGFVTIDGADARDFDDAIHVEELPGKKAGWLLRVAIADVAHYVRTGAALDAEALERGNSCYFPASVEPMLPEALSNGLCSLKPGLPRLAMVAEINFDAGGNPKDADFYPTLIQSHGRLTYEETHAAMELQKPEARKKLSAHLPMLQTARALAEVLLQKRRANGTLAFDLPEPRIKLDANGGVKELIFAERFFAHKLIEEFMIAANEAVARHLESTVAGDFLYRVHPAPDPEKLQEFFQVLSRNGLLPDLPARKKSKNSPAVDITDLQQILDQTRGKPEEYVVNRLLLRSLMQARYTPVPEGHFGLASEAYCHFTSPIRRYADLTVHRVLRRSLGLAEKLPSREQLLNIADSLNESERNAVEAERDIHKVAAALFLQDRLNEEFAAVVSGLSSFGLFVELESMPAEGFVPVEALEDDFYRLDSERQMLIGLRSGRVYRLGQPLRVILDKADPARMEIRFSLSAEQPVRQTLRQSPEPRRGRAPAKELGEAARKSGRKNSQSATGKKPGRAKLPAGSVRRRQK